MKKIFYMFAAMLLAGACSKTLETPAPLVSEDGTVEGAKVTVDFTVPIPPQTRGAMGKNPILDGDMYVLVFNKNQVLKDFAKATLQEVSARPSKNGEEHLGTFTVELNLAKAWRSVHFIANCPIAERPSVSVGEAAVLGSIVSTNGDAAYWQRYVFEDGIDGYTYAGGRLAGKPWFNGNDNFTYAPDEQSYSYPDDGKTITVNKGDYIDRNGLKILTNRGYFASQEMQDALDKIPLVRNFARITVSKGTGSNFTPSAFALAYTPTAGYVAPNDVTKNTLAENWGFVSSYLPATVKTTLPTMSGVASTGYVPNMPASADISATAPKTFVSVDNPDDNGAYMYERSADMQGKDATCIIVKGALDGVTGDRWFKIQLADADGAYFNVYRGVTYNIAIGTITGSDGYATAAEAFANAAVGDLSDSPETANLTEISDDKGTTLTVSSIDDFSLEGSTTYKVLFYRLKQEGVTPSPTNSVTLTVQHISAHHAIATDGLTGQPYNGTGTITLPNGVVSASTPPDDEAGWYYAVVPLTGSESTTKLSKVIVEGPTKANPEKKLKRTVSYRVLTTQKLGLAATPISPATGHQTTLTLTLPQDLPYSMFPLIFKIEADQNNLNPVTANIPVEAGSTTFDGQTKQTFYFLYTVDYSDYYKVATNTYTNVKNLVFKTTKTSTNPLRIKVTDKGGYFKSDDGSAVVNVTVN